MWGTTRLPLSDPAVEELKRILYKEVYESLKIARHSVNGIMMALSQNLGRKRWEKALRELESTDDFMRRIRTMIKQGVVLEIEGDRIEKLRQDGKITHVQWKARSRALAQNTLGQIEKAYSSKSFFQEAFSRIVDLLEERN